MKRLTIGQIAKASHVNIETVRYYERCGLIPKPPRSESGYRLYSEEVINLIRFIKHAKALGFSLREIRELLSLRVEEGVSCAQVKDKAEAKITEIEERIQSLKRMKNALLKLTKECTGKGPVKECPILDALEK
jgi:MerR family mercuric resistance operon transcriptional regulator